MTATREAMIQRVREAVQAGNSVGSLRPLPLRGTVGYQGAADPVAVFRQGLVAAGGELHLATNVTSAVEQVVKRIPRSPNVSVLLGSGAVIDSLDLRPKMHEIGANVYSVRDARDQWFTADLAISGADWLIAETGTVAVLSKPSEPRSLSLLPPVHVVVASEAQIIPDLFDLFDKASPTQLQSCLTLITGPSKTGDIELKLVTGVHGPGQLHVVLIADALV